jgi:hypothetical protein
MKLLESDNGQSSAMFSDDMAYRYRLTRTWEPLLPHAVFCMLNPSTADHNKNDPTVERCERRARATPGVGGLEVVNIFALRSTDPRALYEHDDPVGPENDMSIVAAARRGFIVICGWGKHGALNGRGKVVIELLRRHGIAPHALKLNGDGSPAHPLYIAYTQQPFVIPHVIAEGKHA